MNQSFERQETCEVIVVNLNTKSWGYIEFLCSGGLLGLFSKTQDEVWGFFKKLAWDTYEFEQARETLRYWTHSKYAFHVNPHHQDHFIDSYDHLSYSYAPPILCDCCESSDYDVCNYPDTNYVDATCVSLGKTMNELTNKIIKTMNEKIVECSHCFKQSRRIIICMSLTLV